MSAPDQAVVVSQLAALAADGTVLGLALAFTAVRSLLKFKATNSALHQIKEAPSVRVSDLRSLIGDSEDGKFVIVRGTVQSFEKTLRNDAHDSVRVSDLRSFVYSHSNHGKLVIVRDDLKSLSNDVLKKAVTAISAAEGALKSLRNDVLEKAVIVQQTQTCIYNGWKGFMGWTSDLPSLFSRSWREKESSSTRMVPFVIVEAGRWPGSEYVNVNMDGSSHPLPLETVYHHLQPVDATSLTFLQALFGHQYPVGLLQEEKILPLGKDITAVGICSSIRGTPEIKSCNFLPYFLSEMTEDQMIEELAFKTKVLLWSGVVFGSLAIGILSYAAVRNWNRWKEWRHQRQTQRRNAAAASDEAAAQVATDEDIGDVPDGQLCVICLTRRRRSAFVPCGHLVCCQRCALSVLRDLSPKCPLCRQIIHSSVRIYDS